MPSSTLLAQSVLSGIFTGGLYGLIGLGLSLSWGMLRQINLAHFALVFLGAYLTYQLGASYHVDPFVTLLVTAPIFFAIGAGLHWVFARFGVTAFASLLVTFGLTVMIESLIQGVWTADIRKLDSVYTSLKFKIGPLFVPIPELLTLVVSAALALACLGVLRFTDTGKALRAAVQDAAMASAFGVDEKKLALVLSGFVASSAAVAGVCLALTSTLAPSQIYSWIGVVFAAVIIGGLGNPIGPLLAGIAIGISEALTMALTAPAWAPLVSFSLLIAVLLLRARNI